MGTEGSLTSARTGSVTVLSSPSVGLRQEEPAVVQRLPVRRRQPRVHQETGEDDPVGGPPKVPLRSLGSSSSSVCPSAQELQPDQHQAEAHLHRSGSGEERNPRGSHRPDPELPDGPKEQREGDSSPLVPTVSSFRTPSPTALFAPSQRAPVKKKRKSKKKLSGDDSKTKSKKSKPKAKSSSSSSKKSKTGSKSKAIVMDSSSDEDEEDEEKVGASADAEGSDEEERPSEQEEDQEEQSGQSGESEEEDQEDSEVRPVWFLCRIQRPGSY